MGLGGRYAASSTGYPLLRHLFEYSTWLQPTGPLCTEFLRTFRLKLFCGIVLCSSVNSEALAHSARISDNRAKSASRSPRRNHTVCTRCQDRVNKGCLHQPLGGWAIPGKLPGPNHSSQGASGHRIPEEEALRLHTLRTAFNIRIPG